LKRNIDTSKHDWGCTGSICPGVRSRMRRLIPPSQGPADRLCGVMREELTDYPL